MLKKFGMGLAAYVPVAFLMIFVLHQMTTNFVTPGQAPSLDLMFSWLPFVAGPVGALAIVMAVMQTACPAPDSDASGSN